MVSDATATGSFVGIGVAAAVKITVATGLGVSAVGRAVSAGVVISSDELCPQLSSMATKTTAETLKRALDAAVVLAPLYVVGRGGDVGLFGLVLRP